MEALELLERQQKVTEYGRVLVNVKAAALLDSK